MFFIDSTRYIIVFEKGFDTPSSVVKTVEKKLKEMGADILYRYDTVLNGFAVKLPSDKVTTLESINDQKFPFFIERDQAVTINDD